MPTREIQLPENNRVYQRDENDAAFIPIRLGVPVRVRVRRGKEVLFPWHEVEAGIDGVPTGGPYTIEMATPNDRILRAYEILVGDLWVLAGQSNMDGCGKLVDLEPPSKMVRCYYYTERWAVARDPLCVPVDAMDPVHWPCGESALPEARAADRRYRDSGAGPGVRFGKDLHRATGAPIGLIVCSHGGTSLEQWDPGLASLGGNSLYGSMLRRIRACGGRVKGVLWHQGESDAAPGLADSYGDRLAAFVRSLRHDLNAPDLPFVFAQIGRHFLDENAISPDAWNAIQQAQLDIEDDLEKAAMVATIDSTLSDAIHIDALSARYLGARMAELALVVAYGIGSARALRPESPAFVDADRVEIRVPYRNVRGGLSPSSGIWGFLVERVSGERIAIEESRAQGNEVRLRLEQSAPGPVRLWYGRGGNPTTNLRDDIFAAPVFGPVEVVDGPGEGNRSQVEG